MTWMQPSCWTVGAHATLSPDVEACSIFVKRLMENCSKERGDWSE
ncbi:hypothetical protein ACNOIU_15545 (plasmid) [Exiguobacterium mexicanum]|nr:MULTISPECIES: hypothetical protein [unclassified Exiguobacterium]